MTASIRRLVKALMICGFMAVAGLPAASASAGTQDLSSMVSVTKTERSVTDLKTKLVTTTALITIKNISTSMIGTPLQAVFDVSSAGVQVQGAVAPGSGNPYGKYYVDISNNVVVGKLQTAGSVTFSVKLVCPSTIRYTYKVITYGTIIKTTPTIAWADPAATVYGTPLSITQLNATASTPGSFVYTPASGTVLSAGSHTLRVNFTPTDGTNFTTATATVTITVVQPLPPQVGLSPLTYTVNQGTTLTFAVAGMSPDGRGVTLSALPVIANATFAAISGTAASGTFSFTPSSTQSGIHLISFQARDSLGLTDTKTAQITINKVNHPPVISIAPTVTIDEGKSRVISANVSDPDGDTLTLTATGLPNKNAVFVPSTGTVIFSPDFTQAGTYNVTVKADDGLLSSSATIVITVNDVPNGGTVQPGEWTLNVNPVESPAFLGAQRIMGSVGTEGVIPVLHPAKPALITGMNPAIAEQGTTIPVVLTGDSGDYVTHFASGLSKADFGSGITVNSLTITSPTQASANVTIAGNATAGSRSVTIATGNETAVSVVGFTIVQGKTTLTGRLVDFDTKQPIFGAIVTIEGTMFSTTTNPQGYFTLLNVPSGSQVLLINAVNHELIRSPFEAKPGATIDVGSVTPKATVFDPSVPAGISLGSVVGRGIADTTGTMTEKEAKQLVTDTWLLVGGSDAGVMDAYGNQLNQEVVGQGQISLTPTGVSRLAAKIQGGESTSLLDILYAFSFGYKWSQGASSTHPDGIPPTLPEWITGLQQRVNQAWADPTNPDSQFVILVFNKGRSLSPVPPTIGVDTQLSALQANLLVAGLLVYALDPQGNIANSERPPIMLAYNGELPPGLLLAQLSGPAAGTSSLGGKSVMRNFWKNYFSNSNFLLGIAASTAGASIGMATSIAVFGGVPGTVIAVGMVGVAVGALADVAMQSMVVLNLMALVPTPPIPFKADVITGDDGKKTVKVTFDRSGNDSDRPGSTTQFDKHAYYVYTLYRYDVSPYNLSSGQREEDVTGKVVARICANCPGSPLSYKNPAVIVDPDPTPNKAQYYDLTVTRLWAGNKELIANDSNLASTLDPWGSFLANIGIGSLSEITVGAVATTCSPILTLVNGLKQLTSDSSSMVVAHTGDIALSSADGIAVDSDRGYVYYSDIGKQAIYRLEWPDDNLAGTSLLANTSFKDPGQIGLAIDPWGRLYTDNHASDMDYGGRIFRFTPRQLPDTWDLPIWTADRTFAGSVNYFSQALMFANPASVSRMVYGGINKQLDALTVIDEICNCVKEIPINEQIDPSRIVGETVWDLEGYSTGPVLDLAFDKQNNLFILTNKNVVKAGRIQLEEYINFPSAMSGTVGGMAIDACGNVYVSTNDSEQNGKILMYRQDNCASDSLPSDPVVIMDGLNSPGDIEISKDGRALFIATKDGKLAKRYFGFSGLVRDVSGNPLVGASITLKTEPGGSVKSVRTGADGRFLVKDLFRSDLAIPYATLNIEYNGKSQTSMTRFEQPNGGQYGHIMREITFKPAP